MTPAALAASTRRQADGPLVKDRQPDREQSALWVVGVVVPSDRGRLGGGQLLERARARARQTPALHPRQHLGASLSLHDYTRAHH